LPLQKKVTKEKEPGKDNRFCFSPVAPGALSRSKKQGAVSAFSGLPARRQIQHAANLKDFCFSIRLLMALIKECVSPGVSVLLFLM